MSTAKQSLGDKLPPIRGSFILAIKRTNFQALVWSREPDPVIPDPVGHEWSLAEEIFTPVMCKEPCVPEFLLEIMKGSYIKKCCSAARKCLENNLSFTEICNCNDKKFFCNNAYPPNFTNDESDEADEINL